jgi:hypothetical protein
MKYRSAFALAASTVRFVSLIASTLRFVGMTVPQRVTTVSPP